MDSNELLIQAAGGEKAIDDFMQSCRWGNGRLEHEEIIGLAREGLVGRTARNLSVSDISEPLNLQILKTAAEASLIILLHTTAEIIGDDCMGLANFQPDSWLGQQIRERSDLIDILEDNHIAT